MTGSILLFFILALVAVASAVGMLLSENAVYAALFLIANFGTVAVIYLTLGAPFIALAQVTVYAGAIMVLFLFVIMLLGAEKLSVRGPIPAWQRPLGIILGFALMGETVYLIVFRSGVGAPLSIPSADFASPMSIGLALFNQYLLPFEITSVLLLVAVVGAVMLTRPEKIVRRSGSAAAGADRGRRSVTPQNLPAVEPVVSPQPADLLVYEKEIETEESKGDLAGPGGEDVAPRQDPDQDGMG